MKRYLFNLLSALVFPTFIGYERAELIQFLETLIKAGDVERRGTLAYFARKLLRSFLDGFKTVPFSIFVKGNSKLPFYSFSNLHLVNCPGAGACKVWCYSWRGIRYPAAALRMLQNTVLMRDPLFQERIAYAFLNLPLGVDVRLYVDGDFATWTEVAFWMNLIRQRPDLRVYGYSKSWEQLLEYDRLSGKWPENYKLNLSSGSMHDSRVREQVSRLPITRGSFVAVDTVSGTAREARERYRADTGKKSKVFVCPGKCGSCTPKGHACGSSRFNGIDILIPLH